MWSSTGHQFSYHQHTIVSSSSTRGRNEYPAPLSMLGYVLALAYNGKYFKTQGRFYNRPWCLSFQIRTILTSLISFRSFIISSLSSIPHSCCASHIRPWLMMLWDLPSKWLVAKTSVPIIWSLQRVISQKMIQESKLPMKHQALHDLGDKTSHL